MKDCTARAPGLWRRLALAALAVGMVAALAACGGQKAPETPETGESAGAWAKNDAGYYFNDAGEPIMAATLKGMDVSKYQGEIDWAKAKAAGIDFAILRCGIGSEWNGEGEYTQDDPYWRQNADACTKLGIPFGTYLYSYATTEAQARSEADHVARLLGLKAPDHEGLEDYTASPYALSYPVYYDLEDKAVTEIFPGEMATLVAAFFDQLASYGYTGQQGIYASLNWVRGRFSDPAFDPWRENMWIARFSSELEYTGSYSMWQATYQEPGGAYGVQSETVDLDFVMEELMFTGIADASGKKATPTYTNDTYSAQLWLGQKGDKATLQTDEPAEKAGGQKLFWSTSDKAVATVDKNGRVKAKGDGECVVTATLADGRKSVECTVRVGSVTLSVLATGGLSGQINGDASLADVAALKADTPNAILLDAGGSLHGSVETSLTGGVDIFSAFAYAGYDLQLLDARDLAFGTERAKTVVAGTSGPTLAANLLADTGEPLYYRTTCWSRNRISNGMNVVLQKAGKKLGFFALAGTGNYAGAAALTQADPLTTASEQVAALKAEGADAILCVLGSDLDAAALAGQLKALGVTYLIAGSVAESDAANNILGAGLGATGVARLDLTFAQDGTIAATPTTLAAEALAGWGTAGRTALQTVEGKLKDLAAGDEEVKNKPLFTLADATDTKTISFGNYVAQTYADAALADAENWPEEYRAMVPVALAGGVAALEPGEITRGTLLASLPAPARVQLVLTHGYMLTELIDSGTVSQTYADSLVVEKRTDAPVLLVCDTATLQTLSDQSYTVLRDYGDAFWLVRMAINDATGNFQTEFTLPEAPKYGVGREDLH